MTELRLCEEGKMLREAYYEPINFTVESLDIIMRSEVFWSMWCDHKEKCPICGGEKEEEEER